MGPDDKLCTAVSSHQRGDTVQFPATSPYNERTITVNPSGGVIESGKVSNNCSFVSSVSLSRVHSNMGGLQLSPLSTANFTPRDRNRGCCSAREREGEMHRQGVERITWVRVNGGKCSGTCVWRGIGRRRERIGEEMEGRQ